MKAFSKNLTNMYMTIKTDLSNQGRPTKKNTMLFYPVFEGIKFTCMNVYVVCTHVILNYSERII